MLSIVKLVGMKFYIADNILEEITRVFKVPAEAIKNFDEEKAIYNIQNNYEGSTLSHSSNYQYNYQPIFNPIDK